MSSAGMPVDVGTVSDAACEVMCEVAERDPNLWVLTGDVWTTARLKPYAARFPERFVNIGIAEQCMVGVAAGMATCGKVPVVTAFAPMISMRACEQIRTDVAYNNLNVKIVASGAGFSAAYAGPTHHATEDIALMRAMGNMTVINPCDARETKLAMRAALEHRGPVYVRLGGRSNDYTVHTEPIEYQIGRAIKVADGNDVTLFGCGRTVIECMAAARLLEAKGITARVLDMHTLKPIDLEAVEQASRETRMVFTVEDHNVFGGLGGAVAEAMAQLDGQRAVLRMIAVPDAYAPVGTQELILDHYGLTATHIANAVLAGWSSRSGGWARPSQ